MNSISKNRRIGVRQIATSGILSALTIALALTPFGYLMIPGLNIQITIMHIPTIIAAMLEGPIVGALVGLVFGLSSLYYAVITPLPIAFAFLNPIVSVLPRILIGLVAWYVFKGLSAVLKGKYIPVAIGLAAAAATLTNTIGVLGAIWLIYAEPFLAAIGVTSISPMIAIFALAFPNAPFELLAAILLAIPVVMAVKRVTRPVSSV